MEEATDRCAGLPGEPDPAGWPGTLRPTRQRLAVLAAVRRLGVFASAQQVHLELQRDDTSIGLSTVYRSLHALADHHVLDAVRDEDGEVLYRSCAGAAHHHLVCRWCGNAVEVAWEEVGPLVARWTQGAGFSDVQVVLAVYGTCRACISRDSKSDSHS